MNMYIRGEEDAMDLDTMTKRYEETGQLGEGAVYEAVKRSLDAPPAQSAGNRTIHLLKCDPHCYRALRSGDKKAEVRQDDRAYKVGDVLLMKETAYSSMEMRCHAQPLEYTGREASYYVTHIQRGYGLPSDMVVLSLVSYMPFDGGDL